jgi:peptidylprolyl isomerase
MPTLRHHHRVTLVAGLALTIFACSPESPGGSAGRDAVALSEAVADPVMLTYHPDLGVSLTEMQTRPSGLLLQDLAVGTGDTVEAGMTALVRYSGWLPDGTQFDSNVDLDPVSVRIGAGEVIPGFDEGLVGMRAGGKRKLILPPRLGYGEEGIETIPPNAVLVFDVEIVAIQAP